MKFITFKWIQMIIKINRVMRRQFLKVMQYAEFSSEKHNWETGSLNQDINVSSMIISKNKKKS